MAKKVAAAGPVEGPWALPNGWRWERLPQAAAICDHLRRPINNSERLKRNEGKDPGELYPYYGATGQAGVIDGYLADGEYILLGEDGAPFLDPFKTKAYAVSGRFWVNNHAHVLMGKPHLNARLLLHWLNTLNYEPFVNGTTRLKLTQGAMMEMPVPVPPADIQSCLASRIDELFAEIDDGEAALARATDDLATWRKALLKAAVTGELTADWGAANPLTRTGADLLADLLVSKQAGDRPKTTVKSDVDFSTDDLPALPSDWIWCTVGQIANVTGGITKNAKRNALPLRMPYLRVGNVYAGRVDLTRIETIGVSESEAERSAVKCGDLLIVEGNGSIDQIGRSAIWDGQIDPCLHQNHLIKVRVVERQTAEWMQVWLQSPWGRKELEAQASSTSGLHTLSISKVAGLRCPIPPRAEREEVLLMVQRLIAEATAGGDDINAIMSPAATLRQSVLAAAFRGELA